jgi:hypothetical protein
VASTQTVQLLKNTTQGLTRQHIQHQGHRRFIQSSFPRATTAADGRLQHCLCALPYPPPEPMLNVIANLAGARMMTGRKRKKAMARNRAPAGSGRE